MTTEAFYDQLAPFYHLIYPDWEARIQRQAAALQSIIREHWSASAATILDVACGIGTQAMGLAALGYTVTASDLSSAAIERAKRETARRGLAIDFSVADMRQTYTHHRRQFDLVLAAGLVGEEVVSNCWFNGHRTGFSSGRFAPCCPRGRRNTRR